MGKKSKSKAATPSDVERKERKQLKARAAEIEKALADAKAAKKAKKAAKARREHEQSVDAKVGSDYDSRKPKGKKGGKSKKAKAVEPQPEKSKAGKPKKAKPGAGTSAEETHTPAEILAAADAVLADPNASEGAQQSARAARGKALANLSDADLKARVEDKKTRRKELEASADSVDRDDHDAVEQYNAQLAELGGGRFITSTAEIAKEAARLAGGDDGRVAAHEAKQAKRKAGKDELTVTMADTGETLAEPLAKQVVEQVETEKGREFVAGAEAAVGDEFAKPSEAVQTVTLEEGRNGYKIHPLKADGTPDLKKELQFTRATTYIDNLEDKRTLEDWKLRVLLEGVAINDTNPASLGNGDDTLPDSIVAEVRDLMHRRDVKLAKAAKADRKGKLTPGELAGLEFDARKEFKDAANDIAQAAMEVGGAHDKADAGTDLHALVQSFDLSGLSVDEFAAAQAETIAPSSLDSLRAYDAAMRAIGAKVIDSEIVVVDDERKVAGRLDSRIMVKLPGTARATRVVGDIKSGKVEYGIGKIAQQLDIYANAKEYNIETGERTDQKLSKSVGLLIHLPQGGGTCTIHIVDLKLGHAGNELSGRVRAWRNEGKKAIDLARDIAAVS